MSNETVEIAEVAPVVSETKAAPKAKRVHKTPAQALASCLIDAEELREGLECCNRASFEEWAMDFQLNNSCNYASARTVHDSLSRLGVVDENKARRLEMWGAQVIVALPLSAANVTNPSLDYTSAVVLRHFCLWLKEENRSGARAGRDTSVIEWKQVLAPDLWCLIEA